MTPPLQLSLLAQGRPCGRPPAAAVLGRQPTTSGESTGRGCAPAPRGRPRSAAPLRTATAHRKREQAGGEQGEQPGPSAVGPWPASVLLHPLTLVDRACDELPILVVGANGPDVLTGLQERLRLEARLRIPTTLADCCAAAVLISRGSSQFVTRLHHVHGAPSLARPYADHGVTIRAEVHPFCGGSCGARANEAGGYRGGGLGLTLGSSW
jgi:hypothetical protein